MSFYSKSWWYDSKTTKWQIVIGSVIIAIIFLCTFSFLSIYEFEEWKYSGFTKSLMGILMSTIALGAITGIIIIFQNLVAMDREKNQKIFSKRLELYKNFTNQTMRIISDDHISEEEAEELKVIEKEILMIASPATYKKWYSLYMNIKELREEKDSNTNDKIKEKISDSAIDFINSCRRDLEIGEIDKDTLDFSKKASKKEINESGDPIWKIIQNSFNTLDQKSISKRELKEFILKKYPYIKPNTLSCQITIQTVNNPSRRNFSSCNKPRLCDGSYYYDWLYENEDKTLSKFDVNHHGVWSIYKKEDGKLDVKKADL